MHHVKEFGQNRFMDHIDVAQEKATMLFWDNEGNTGLNKEPYK